MNFDLNGLFNTINGVVSNTAATLANVYTARAGLAQLRTANAAATAPTVTPNIIMQPAQVMPTQSAIDTVAPAYGSNNMLMIGGAVALVVVLFLVARR
jgi:hypothetical protein